MKHNNYNIIIFNKHIYLIAQNITKVYYIIELLEQYGFRLSSPIESVKPLSDFSTLYKKMRATDQKITMTEEESQISFLNNYFIFKKIQNVDTERVHQFYTQDKEIPATSIGVPIRLNKKIVLKDK
jgi:hypothetical protein